MTAWGAVLADAINDAPTLDLLIEFTSGTSFHPTAANAAELVLAAAAAVGRHPETEQAVRLATALLERVPAHLQDTVCDPAGGGGRLGGVEWVGLGVHGARGLSRGPGCR